MSDPKVVFLAPECCYDRGSFEGRNWCEDNVWPCDDCPDRAKARVPRYVISGYVEPAVEAREEGETAKS